MVEHIFVLFIGRTGSTYLMQIFKSLYSCDVLCKYGEIFTTIEAIMGTFDAKNKLGIDEENYRKFALENPIEYIEFINKNIDPSTKYIFSKIQIPYLMSKSLDLINKILTYPNSRIIIVKRNLLDTYISEQKAKQINKWSETNTTNYRIKINPINFFDYYCKTRGYYNRLEHLLNGIQYIEFDYDKVHNHNTNNEKINYIITMLRYIGIRTILDKSKYNECEILLKQDNNTKREDKIINFNEVKAFLITKGLFKLLN